MSAKTCWPGLIAAVGWLAGPVMASIIMPPYLQSVTGTSILVLVECGTITPATVEYGPAENCEWSAAASATAATTGGTWVHQVELAGLVPATRYYYRARHGEDVSAISTFTTAPPPGASFRVGFMADCRTGVAVHDQIAGQLLGTSPGLLLYGGDLCYNGSYAAFKDEFFRPAQKELIRQIPFVIACGNHETWGINTRAFTAGPTANSGTPDYGSFDYGDLHVTIINNQVDYSPGSAQALFVQADLAASASPWKIVISHSPPYCAGGHGEDSGMIMLAENAIRPGGARLLLSGHSHFYQRNEAGPVQYVIAGSSGAPLANPGQADYTLCTIKSYNFCLLEVTPDSLAVHAFNQDRILLDSFRLIRREDDPADLDANLLLDNRDLHRLARFLSGGTAVPEGRGDADGNGTIEAVDLVALAGLVD